MSVYRIVGPGGCYVGSTQKDPEQRLKKHLDNSVWRDGALYDSIREHGKQAFQLEVLHTGIATLAELRSKEGDAIRQYDSINHGWNRYMPGRDRAQWRAENKTLIAEYNRQYRAKLRALRQPPAEEAPPAEAQAEEAAPPVEP